MRLRLAVAGIVLAGVFAVAGCGGGDGGGGEALTKEEWIAQALTPTGPQPTYGFMNYFLNTGQRQWPSAPPSTFCHLGNGTNAVCVLPDHDMVVVLRWIRGNAVDGVLKRLIEATRPAP